MGKVTKEELEQAIYRGELNKLLPSEIFESDTKGIIQILAARSEHDYAVANSTKQKHITMCATIATAIVVGMDLEKTRQIKNVTH